MNRALVVCALVLVTGCKSNLWKDISEKEPGDSEVVKQRGLCLGVTVAREERPTAIGVLVERVLKESPADKAGIVPGDEIRTVGGHVVRSARELESALRLVRASGDSVRLGATTTDVVVALDGEERMVRVKLVPWTEQLDLARTRCQTHAKTFESTVTVPFIFDYSKLSVPVALYRDYHGRTLSEPLLLYRDIDVVPVLGIFSLFRFERSEVRDAWRLQLLVWPLEFTKIEDDESLKELLAPGEDRFEVL